MASPIDYFAYAWRRLEWHSTYLPALVHRAWILRRTGFDVPLGHVRALWLVKIARRREIHEITSPPGQRIIVRPNDNFVVPLPDGTELRAR
jgi:hypothetical protein